MPFQPLKKATLLMPSGPPDDPDRLHLWVILTDPCAAHDANLVVDICTLRDGRFHDPACLIQQGEHRRIKHTSWVGYHRCKAVHSSTLKKGAAAWLYHPDEPVSDVLFDRICAGILDSDHTAVRMRRYFEGKGLAF